MQFKTFTARRITLKRATNSELETYKQQVKTHNEQDRLNIISECDYLKVEKEDGRMIGLIQIDEIDETTASIKISIPNETWRERYGTEALHQFIKCCKERKLYKRVYFKTNNSIVEKYKRERPKIMEKKLYIDIEAI